MRARKHFSQSVDLLKTGNARGLHGLCQTCASLASCKVGGEIEASMLFAAVTMFVFIHVVVVLAICVTVVVLLLLLLLISLLADF